MSPIVISMALTMGISPVPWCVVLAIGTNLAIATPIGTAVNMQILPAGYTWKDFGLTRWTTVPHHGRSGIDPGMCSIFLKTV